MADVEATLSPLYVAKSNIWKTTPISVCFEQGDGFNEEQRWVSEALSAAWEADVNIRFTGFSLCSRGRANLHVNFKDERVGTDGLGTDLDNETDGVSINVHRQSNGNCGGTNWSRERCVKASTVHEFGHALGFAHEQNRTERSCQFEPSGHDGDVKIGDWDEHSVMNYCNPIWANDGELSASDIMGAEIYYGAIKPTSSVAVDGALNVFMRGSDYALWHWSSTGSDEPMFESHGGRLGSAPSAVSWGAGHMEVFARGTDGNLWHIGFDNGWQSWESLGGPIVGQPIAIARAGNKIDVFARGPEHSRMHIKFDGQNWLPWDTSSDVRVIERPAVASWGPNRLDVFWRDASFDILHEIEEGSTTSAQMLTVAAMMSNPTAVSSRLGRIDLVFVDADGSLQQLSTDDGIDWGSRRVGALPFGDPQLIAAGPGQPHLFYRSADNSLAEVSGRDDLTEYASHGGVVTAAPDPVVGPQSELNAFVRGTDNKLWWAQSTGSEWFWQNAGGIIF